MTNSYPAGSPGVPDSMATGAPGFMPRRSSYASVVSGTASGISQPYQQPARSGAFSHLLNQGSDLNYEMNYQQSFNGSSRFDNRGYDMEYNTNGGGHGRSASWSRGAQLPSFSSAFGSVMNGYAYGALGGIAPAETFFVPSYLKGSKYVQKLEEAHKAKLAALKDGQSAPASQTGSLSTSASSANLHAKMTPSHRGMTYDLIEKAPPLDDETLPPLPTKLNSQDKQPGLEVLADGQEVKFTGPKPDRDRDHEACAIRADHPMPPQCGIYYFEVTIISRKREESSIGIGFSGPKVPLARLPGWEPDSWAYHGDDGHSFCCQTSGKHYGPPFSAGDTIGCGVDFRSGSAFFTKNGDHLGTAFRDIKGKLYPSVGMKRAGEHVRMNFGQSPFIFDIDGMMSASNISSSSQFSPSNGRSLSPSPGRQPSISESRDSLPDLVPASPPEAVLSTSSRNSPDSPAPSRPSSLSSPMDPQPHSSTSMNQSPSHSPIPVLNERNLSNGSLDQTPALNNQTTAALSRLVGVNGAIIQSLRLTPLPDLSVEDSLNSLRNTSHPSSELDHQVDSSRVNPTISIQRLNRAIPLMTIPSVVHPSEPQNSTPATTSQGPFGYAPGTNRSAAEQQQSYDLFMAAFRTAAQQELEDTVLLRRSPPRASRTIAPRRSLVPLELARRQRLQQGTPPGTSNGEDGSVSGLNVFPSTPWPGLDEMPDPDQPSTIRIQGRLPPVIFQSNTPLGNPTIGETLPEQPSPEILANWLIYRQICGPQSLATWTDLELQRERNQIRTEIETTSTEKLAPHLSETELIQSLVLQFLTHDGYVETARAFAEEIHTEKRALSLKPDAVTPGYDLKEDEDAGHRQKIRASILEGDIEKALKYTNAYYPHVLKDNEHVNFRLKCRRFVEMIRQGAELHNSNSTNGVKKVNVHNGDWYDDIINHDMDIDDHQPQNNNWDRMDTEENSVNQLEYQRLLQETLAYGQDLQAEFKDDPRREVSKALEDAFALMAYEDPINAKEVAHLLDPSGRVAVAEELNSAILQSLGKSSSAALEQLYQQTTVLLEELREGGGPGAFVNIDDFARP